MAAEIFTVTSMPRAMLAQYCAKICGLQNVSTNCCHAVIGLTHQLGDDRTRAAVTRRVEDRRRRALLDEPSLIDEHDAVGGLLRKPQYVADD